MRLILYPLKTYLEQKVTATRSGYLAAIRPHLYRHLNPAGALKIELRSSGGVLIATSETIQISALGAGANYFHGYVRFYLNASVVAGTDYFIRLVPVGYAFGDASYIAWCNDFDLRKYSAGYTPSNYWRAALDLEAFEFVTLNRGIA